MLVVCRRLWLSLVSMEGAKLFNVMSGGHLCQAWIQKAGFGKANKAWVIQRRHVDYCALVLLVSSGDTGGLCWVLVHY